MHSNIEAIFDEAENRYLKTEELGLINQYVDSLPARLDTYRTLRDRELEVMQQVADQLQAAMPQEKVENLERCIKTALLTLRYCAMAMLLNDESFVRERLLSWVCETAGTYQTQTIDATLYRLLNQHLAKTLTSVQMGLFAPMLKLAETAILQPTAAKV